MSLNLNIPITQTLTLPDNWQACKTPQELSYWIIAKFEGFTSSLTDINNALSQLSSMVETNTDNIATNDAEIAEIKTSIANINTTLGEINTSIESINSDYGLLHSNYMAMNNRLATVEDVAGDIPTIKNDVTKLQTNVNTNTENVTTLQTDVSTNTGNITTLTNSVNNLNNSFYNFIRPVFYNNSTTILSDVQIGNTKSAVMFNSSMDYRQFINVSDTAPTGTAFTIYYNSDYNVPFGHYDTSINGTDITTSMESSSIDGNITLTDLLTKTKVAIKFFKTNLNKKYSWAVL